MYFIVRLLIHMVAILIIAYLLPGIIWVNSWQTALAASFVLGIVNAVLRPVLIFFTLPLTILSLGAFLLVVNALMLSMVAALVPGFHVNGLFGGIAGSVLISLVSWIMTRFVAP